MPWKKWLLTSMSAVVGSLASQALAQQPTNITMYGRTFSTSNIYDSRHLCYTAAGQTGSTSSQLCAAINRLMVTNWNNSTSSDVVLIPHRGLWGPLSIASGGVEASENTMLALKSALTSGYRLLEIDAAMAGPGCPAANNSVFLGHYFSMMAVSGGVYDQPCNYSSAQLKTFYMRRRDGTATTVNGNQLPAFSDVIQWARQNQVLLMVDPKVPGIFNADGSENYLKEQEQYAQIIWQVLEASRSIGALANITIKTTYTRTISISDFTPDDHYNENYDGQFLWSPIVNKSLCVTKKDCTNQDLPAEESTVLQAIDSWDGATGGSKQVATYEIGLFNTAHWAANPFTWNNVLYQGLIDYAARKGACSVAQQLCKRSAIWSIDPMADKGTLGRTYNWKFIGNEVSNPVNPWEDDERGSVFVNLSYGSATNGTGTASTMYSAVITDRPDVYKQAAKTAN